ncbi:MAG: LPS assembly lipoprotein LptE [Aestuariivirga sp.]
MLKATLALLLCLTLAACGTYRPLYGKRPDGTSVAESLSSMAVQEQHTRSGQLLRNELLDGTQSGAGQRFTLKLDVTERVIYVASLSSSSAARKRFSLTAYFELFDAKSDKSATAGDSFSNVEFDTVNVPVSDLQAEDAARSRAAKELGQDIRLRLATFLATQKS